MTGNSPIRNEHMPLRESGRRLSGGMRAAVGERMGYFLAPAFFSSSTMTARHSQTPFGHRDQGVAGTGRALRIWLTISMASRCAAAGPSMAVTFPVPRTMPVFGLIILKIQSYVSQGRVTSI